MKTSQELLNLQLVSNLMTGWGMPCTAAPGPAATSVLAVKTLEVVILFDDTGVWCWRRAILPYVYAFFYLKKTQSLTKKNLNYFMIADKVMFMRKKGGFHKQKSKSQKSNVIISLLRMRKQNWILKEIDITFLDKKRKTWQVYNKH